MPISASSEPVDLSALWKALQEALPGRFPAGFEWECSCKRTGFPGCDKLPCFLNRVIIALLDYHQVQESTARGDKIRTKECNSTAANPNSFSEEREQLYEEDVAVAIQTLESNGLKRKE